MADDDNPNNLQNLVEGKDSKILAREIGRAQKKIDGTRDSIREKLDEKFDNLPCEEREERIDNLEEWRGGEESVQEERERQERQWYHSWRVYLEVIVLVTAVIAIIIQALGLL